MQLYTFFRSSASFRVRIVLAYKGMPYEARYTSLPKMEHATESFRKINPQGLVPVLVDDAGKVLTQSMAMIEYLDDLSPAPPIMPRTPHDKWYVRAASQIIGCEIHPLNNLRVLKYLRSAYGLSEDQVNKDWYPHWISEGLAALEGFLVGEGRAGRYCLGDQFTMADACLVPQIYNAKRFNCDLAPYPLTMRIFAACEALDAVKASVPAVQGDAT